MLSTNELISAAKRGDIEKVRSLLTQGVDVNADDKYGKTALYYAVEGSYTEIVEPLLSHKEIDINIRYHPGKTEPHGETVLILAAYMGHKKIVELLLSHKKINVNAKTLSGRTALRVAAEKNHIEIVKLLLECGRDVNTESKKEIIKLLLKHEKIDVNVEDGDYFWLTALHLAASNNLKEIVELLLNCEEVDVNDKLNEKTALHVAAEKGYKEIAELLLKHEKIDVNVEDEDCFGLTALHIAVNNNRKEIVELLLKHEEIDVNAKAKYDYDETALHIAANSGYKEITELLLGHKGIDIKAKDCYGNTALYLAANSSYKKVVKLLLKHRVNFEDENLRYAIINNQKEIMCLLLIYSATPGEDSESEINKKPELKESLIMLKEIKKTPNSGKPMEMNKNIEENTDIILGFINDKDKKQELIREFETIKKRHPYERLFFILEYLLDFIKHIFSKLFTNKKVMATELHKSKDNIKVTTKDGTVLKNLPYEAAEKIVSYFDADTNKAVSL